MGVCCFSQVDTTIYGIVLPPRGRHIAGGVATFAAGSCRRGSSKSQREGRPFEVTDFGPGCIHHATSTCVTRTLLGAPGIATRSKDATRSKGHFYTRSKDATRFSHGHHIAITC